MSTRILLVDDHNVVRAGVRALLEGEVSLEVVGEASDGASAVQLATELSPDVVLMDVGMAGMNGIDTTRRICELAPSVRVLALSMHREARFVAEMLRAGARGYLLKTCDLEELLTAIRTVAGGDAYVSPAVSCVLVGLVGRCGAPAASASNELSPREREVLGLVAEGLTTKEIAARLHRSAKTIDMHRRHIMGKLGIHSVAELTKYAVREGLTSVGE